MMACACACCTLSVSSHFGSPLDQLALASLAKTFNLVSKKATKKEIEDYMSIMHAVSHHIFTSCSFRFPGLGKCGDKSTQGFG